MAKTSNTVGAGSNVVLDLETFVRNIKTLLELLEPFNKAHNFLAFLRSWESIQVSMATWLLCISLCWTLTTGSLAVLSFLLASAVFGVGYLHMETNFMSKIYPGRTKLQQKNTCFIQTESTPHSETIAEFKERLVWIDGTLILCNSTLESICSVIRWEEPGTALRYHLAVFCIATGVIILPVRWCFLFGINWFYLGKIQLGQDVLKKLFNTSTNTLENEEQEMCPETNEELSNINTQDCDAEDKQRDMTGICETLQNVPDSGTSSESENDGDVEKSESLSQLSQSPSRTGIVGRIAEFRKRQQDPTAVSCHDCKVAFTSILKRRRACSNCGNHFCSKCCNQKVTRSVLGATAPAAQTATVVVCTACYLTLNEQNR